MTHRKRLVLTLCALVAVALLFFAGKLRSALEKGCEIPKKLQFSTVNHPQVQGMVQPLLVAAYKDLGIEVEFVVASSMRDLMLVSENQLMGSAIFTDDIILQIPNVIRIYPKLTNITYILLCRAGVVCDAQAILGDAVDSQVAISKAMSRALLHRYPNVSEGRLLITNDVKNVITLLAKERVDFGLYPISETTGRGIDDLPTGFQYVRLFENPSYHILNEKYACIKPKLEKILPQKLDLFRTKFNRLK